MERREELHEIVESLREESKECTETKQPSLGFGN